MIAPRTLAILHLLLLLGVMHTSTGLQAADFDTMVVPSLMDSEMDGWYRIPTNSGPYIHKAHSIYPDQQFNLLIFFRGYQANQDNLVHVTYDVQVYDPNGKPTEDTGTNLLAYKGPIGHPTALMLNQQYMKITFTEHYPIGNYKIKVSARDNISDTSFVSETLIELVPFSWPEPFASQHAAAEWMMQYYLNPSPVKAIGALQQLLQPEPAWLTENLSILSFFQTVFEDNPFLLKNIDKEFQELSIEDKKRFLLIASIIGDTDFLLKNTESLPEDLKNDLLEIAGIQFPDMNDAITNPTQLDILWTEFLATGNYAPIRKIVSSLALSEHTGTIDKIKSGEIKTVTQEIKEKAYLEATHQSAIWSLLSNMQQMPLVMKYAIYIYQNEHLDENIKNQLGAIIKAAQANNS